ncbi:sigma-54-dependent Fis family transcriptional regulator [Pyxidicoccus fallax]|uniref:Sigma-54-dependent Fis family transcriptional regulator n=1 Tax=Pyxidicoccus fallax TaxID=394095 RepID=A0A848LV16_9BACT|nr:sigma-54 dependent transcriptional regulator [Pyxidicoccus fallax]NMO21489.1 sigma-54-dependent Fis family transcriptional regulator [Pyxidicoccus fallax]NPC82772.1 sigma-54-dependent Fis family transcriptional regulator [Pyxidicoccus fallax]
MAPGFLLVPVSPDDTPASLLHPERREPARRRRLAVLAACAAPQPLSLSVLADALGDALLDGAHLACDAGLCRKLPGGTLAPAGSATLDMAVNLLEVPEVRATCARLAPLASAPDEALLLMLAADPLGEGRRRLESATGRAASMVEGLRHALDAPSARTRPTPWDFEPWGAQARWASALLATTAHVLVRMGHPESGHALVAWALGPKGLTGRVAGAHGFLAPTHFQFLLDAGRREEGVAFAREAREALDDATPESTYSRLMLTVLEGRVAMDAGDEKLARRLFTSVETQARAAGLGDMVGLAKVAFATLARRAEQNTAAIQLGLAALELLCGEVPFESVALLGLGHAYSREGRHLEAQAALTRALPGLDIPFQQLRAYPQAIATDCFLGDTAEAERKLAALVALAADTPEGRLSIGLGRAHLQCARGEWEAALATLDGLGPLDAAPIGWLRVEALLALGRAREAARVLDALAQGLYLREGATQPARLHLLDARVALANGDASRARRALRRASARPDRLRAQDLALRAQVLTLQLAEDGGTDAQRLSARQAALAEWRRLTEPLSPEARARFRRVYDRPQLLALLGEAPAEEVSAPAYLRGGSAAFRAAMAQLRRVASSDTSVLLFGETGVGKELAARAIHDVSRRAAGPFVAVNCAAINDELLLSDLFGHERGSFTGAVARQRGRFEQAHGGTLFLDEVADISPRGQAALLRALQERAFQRVGGTEEVRVDVRVVAASNRNLAKAVRAGEFRQDLFFRLNGIHVELPPLRERGEDVLLLATHFLQEAAQERGGPPKSFSPEAERLLRAHPWPGNVRELHNTVRAADVLSDTRAIGAAVLAPLLQRALECAEPRPALAGMTDVSALFRQHGGSLRDFLAEVQRQCIAQSLVENGGNVVATAAALRISRSRLTQVVLGNAELRRMSGREQDAPPAPARRARARRA